MADEDRTPPRIETETQLKLQAQIERKGSKRDQSMLDKALGPERAVVRRARSDGLHAQGEQHGDLHARSTGPGCKRGAQRAAHR